MKNEKNAGIGFFERYLTLWVFLCMAVGVSIGQFLPSVPAFLNRFEYANVSIPIAVLIWVTIYSRSPSASKPEIHAKRPEYENPVEWEYRQRRCGRAPTNGRVQTGFVPQPSSVCHLHIRGERKNARRASPRRRVIKRHVSC
jgi:hypothetical protein